MFQSIFSFGQSVVRRILPFGTLDEDEHLVDPNVISVTEFLEIYQRVAFDNGSETDVQDLATTISNASDEWFRVLVGKEGLLTLLNAPSKKSQMLLNELIFRDPKFLQAILSNQNSSAQQLANGVKESPVIRRHVYLLLVALGMHSYDGYVLIYKTVNLLQKERPNGMFQYIAEEIGDVTQGASGPDANLEALVPPLALMVVLFAGGNGFFIENHLRQQIQSSKLLTSIVDIAKNKFVEEKHNRRLELPTLKEPSSRDTPQINRAIEILEQAERSSDKILVWLEKFASSDELAPVLSDNEYMLTLSSDPAPVPPPQPTPRISPPRTIVQDVYRSQSSTAIDRLGPVRAEEEVRDAGDDISVKSMPVDLEAARKERPVAEVKPMEHAVAGSGTIPPPPPPPPVMNADGSFTVDGVVQKKSLLKPLRWTKLDASQDVVARTIWEPRRDTPPVALDKLEELFKNERSHGKYAPSQHGSAPDQGDTTATDLISSQTELRINVILKQFPDMAVEEIAKRIEKCDTSDFDESQLKEFLAALPTDREFTEIDKLKRDGGDTGHLKPAEKFLFSLLDVDHLKLRLEVMLYTVEFPIEERSIRRNCDDIINACKIVQSSQNYRRFLHYLLQVGNKMNEGRAIGNAAAFDTVILPKLSDTPSSRPGYNLLSFIVDELREGDAEVLKFMDELAPAFEHARVPLVQMKNELLAAREKYAQLLEELQEVEEPIRRELERLLQGMRQRLNSLTNIVVSAQTRVRNLAMYLLEDPATFAVHEYLEMLADFCQTVRTILAAPVRRGSFNDAAALANGGPHREHKVPAFASPIMKDPRMASVFNSLRSELQTTVVRNVDDEE